MGDKPKACYHEFDNGVCNKCHKKKADAWEESEKDGNSDLNDYPSVEEWEEKHGKPPKIKDK